MGTKSSESPLSGLWKPTQLQRLHYGPESVSQHLRSCLPSPNSKAFIITGSSLANKTTLVRQVQEILTPDHHAGTFSNIKEHAPIVQLDQATEAVKKDSQIDTIISVGGGSPIDSAKAISYRVHEKVGKFLYHIAIPTTLSASECTFFAGYTGEDGIKTGVGHPQLAPSVIIYDAKFGLETPQKLWLSTAIRALDHAVELQYHTTATEIARQSALAAIGEMFKYLPKGKAEPHNEDYITRLQLASFNSLFPLGTNVAGNLGLSHSLGYALGSPYSIPHGITSCITLGKVVKFKAENLEDAIRIARALSYTGQTSTGDAKEDAVKVGDAIIDLVRGLDLESSPKQYGVGEDQIPKITKLATKQSEGPLYDRVAELVKSL